MNKIEARKKALEARKLKDNKEVSKIVLNNIVNSKILDKYDNIGIYYPIGKEIDISELVNIYPNKSFYLPVTKEEIYFAKYDSNLEKGPFNTMEPKGLEVSRNNIECFIIPCVAISKDNKRVGYGKGYYDRYLKDYNGLMIGVCYKDSSDLDIDMDLYDVALDIKYTG